ncbi:hypothetical protein KKF03_04790 [Patescibacteria group bacterium]|nr:hypothetical protein [Patescibacteria group bacterium]MBU1911112.1 hypothetical protein [Patescibacteria group bacterium]
MLYTVLTTSRSPGISSGLTYESKDESIKEGTHVSVSLRNQLVEGIVIDVIKKKQSYIRHQRYCGSSGKQTTPYKTTTSNSAMDEQILLLLSTTGAACLAPHSIVEKSCT